MNAPLPTQVLDILSTAQLDDKYTAAQGLVFMSGVQALVRLPLIQQLRDRAQGLHTAGFISGYRGSPLGGLDQALWKAKTHLDAQGIVFQPGVNEELAATAVWGSQQLDLYREQAKVDGVFGLWYAKGPGVDRSCDALKHANMAGTSKHGGVIAVAGDDHVAKSSSLPHQSDHIFKACGLPVFFPTSVQDILDLGLHAWAMSRFSGLWCGFKTIQDIVESSSSVNVDPQRVQIQWPLDFALPPGGVHLRWPDTPLEQEARMMNHKWYAALAYIRANRLNHTVIDTPNARLGLIASGKAYNDMRQALCDLGLSAELCAQLGLRVHKVNVVWPLEASITREFTQGLQEILVIEEKRQMIEYQLKEELYNWREDVRPNVLGKFNEPEGDRTGGEWAMANPSANWLLPAQADLNPAMLAKVIYQRLDRLGLLAQLSHDQRAFMARRIAEIHAKEQPPLLLKEPQQRPPWFCSGCPHNSSTRLPEGSRAMAGIGCHYMALWMDRSTSTFTQMGGEGVPWVGLAPFSREAHCFANLGDGTYFHSGLLALRQSIAAGVNITYKILYNGAVAMTGGQAVEGHLSVAQMSRELEAEGVSRIAIVSDAPEKYRAQSTQLAPGVSVHDRAQLGAVQQQLRVTAGCSVLIYDQSCATEKRRRRKRGLEAELHQHLMINPAVCEGCGDCSVQSNCLSVEPLPTDLGTKRQINQHSCNQDFSCLAGLCPSFVMVHGQLRHSHESPTQPRAAQLPSPPEPTLPGCAQGFGIVVAGIGGTGVITLGQILGMAAHLEGKTVVTQDAAGLAQKGGATWSHVQIAAAGQAIYSTHVATARADTVLGCDAIVAALSATLDVVNAQRTHMLLNTHAHPTATALQQRDWQYPSASCAQRIATALGEQGLIELDATQWAEQLLGDSLYANALMLGLAWQKGWIPLSQAALFKALSLNAVAVELNQDAFVWGRHLAHDLEAVRRLIAPARPVIFQATKTQSLSELVAHRYALLCDYQDHAYAERYKAFIAEVSAAEQPLGCERLSRVVAQQLYKLMAYKDEYEVARLHVDPRWRARVAAQMRDGFRIEHYVSPPFLAARDGAGRPKKYRMGVGGQVLLAWLARMKGLRGTPLDVFGYGAERRRERLWIQRYEQSIRSLLDQLSAANLDLALEIAQVPEQIKGYGPVKQRAQESAEQQLTRLLSHWTGKRPPQ